MRGRDAGATFCFACDLHTAIALLIHHARRRSVSSTKWFDCDLRANRSWIHFGYAIAYIMYVCIYVCIYFIYICSYCSKIHLYEYPSVSSFNIESECSAVHNEQIYFYDVLNKYSRTS